MNTHESRRSFRWIFSLAIVLLIAGGCSQSAKWEEYNNNAYLPAKVETIIFASGNRLDSENSILYAKWEVKFPRSSLPVAKHHDDYNDGHIAHSGISISRLSCTHSIIGSVDCYMWLGYTFPDGKPWDYSLGCKVIVPKQGGSIRNCVS